MRKIYLLLASLLVVLGCYAQKAALHTSTGVSYYNGTGALLSAYNAATSGDTIYLSGGGFTSPALIEKGLRIIGAGHYPDSTLATAKTIVTGDITLSENADMLHLEGIELRGKLLTASNHEVDFVTIKYSRITDVVKLQGNLSTPCKSWLFINCVLYTVDFQNAVTCGVYNNIITYQAFGSGHAFENNIFLANADIVFIYGDNNIFKNNIIAGSAAGGNRYIEGLSNQFYNNIFQNDPHLGTNPIYEDNFYPVNIATVFVNLPGYPFNYDYNYHLQAPETYLGTDNKQVGIYGGNYPYKEGAVPSNPHIYMKNIAAQTDSQGQLQIQIGVEAQTH